MSAKMDCFAKRTVAEIIHRYLISLPNTKYDDSAKSPSIGYKNNNHRFKFATLHGGGSYQSLVLHIEPGNRDTTLGKELQKDIQELLGFEISESRNHCLKTNEVYIPLEKLDSLNPIENIENLIIYAFHKQDALSY